MIREALHDPNFNPGEGPLDPTVQHKALKLLVQPEYIGTTTTDLPTISCDYCIHMLPETPLNEWTINMLGCGHLKSVLLQPEQYQVPYLSLVAFICLYSGGEPQSLSFSPQNRPGVRSLSGFWSHSMTICGITSMDLSWAMLYTTTHFMATIGRPTFQLSWMQPCAHFL